MLTFILIGLAGFAAQLVDGGLGMGFGITSTTILIALAGLGPAQAVAAVNAAQLGTTFAAGVSHWRFGNVNWKAALKLGIPGMVLSFIGATVLSNLSVEAARPLTGIILMGLGIHLVMRFSRGRAPKKTTTKEPSGGLLFGLGSVGGFLSSTGGGGWGPVTMSTLLTMGRSEPRRIVGTVSASEFLVSIGGTAGFVVSMWDQLVENAMIILALLIGGVVAAPIAAFAVSRLNPYLLGGLVGTMLVVLNIPAVFGPLDLSETVLWIIRAAVLIVGFTVTIVGARRAREKAHEVEIVEAVDPDRERATESVHNSV
ncbi:sulfite exporter TauE/SafE family protein [Corynebacterium breve]|uniref:Probable membrane transporter protein n=1 Tax=Corynebacterium breve TaxID=3049799 RepID=A0ABY8VGR8_9CORY|nr:sulfite exporter TauE/SafE family protein [Corynebacterium breve]WIM67458.1 sulfite exporter TauE/SafE family protein [Corynebacterium breve]